MRYLNYRLLIVFITIFCFVVFLSGSMAVQSNNANEEYEKNRILKIVKNSGGTWEVLKEINLTECFKNNYHIEFDIKGIGFKLEKDENEEIYTLISENGKRKAVDLRSQTEASIDIDYLITCSLRIESQYPQLIKPSSGLHRVSCGETMKLYASENNSVRFHFWEGVEVNERFKNPLYLKVDEDKTIEAVFKLRALDKKTLTLNVKGEGGIISQELGELDTPANIKISPGMSVTLEAKPKAGWYFQGWRGDINNNMSQVTVTIKRNMKILALFGANDGIGGQPGEKLKIERGTNNEEKRLSKYLFYFEDQSLYKINTAEESAPTPQKIDCDLMLGKNFNNFIYPDEDGTGNRFIVFYENRVKAHFSFVAYDKLFGQFHEFYHPLEEQGYEKVEAIYPADYPAGGNYIHAAFTVVFTYRDGQGSRKFALFQYCRAAGKKMIITKLEDDVISQYYSHYEKKLGWIKQRSSRIEFQAYSVKDETITKPVVLAGNGDVSIRFMAFNYLVVEFAGRNVERIYIYRIESGNIITEGLFKNSDFFSRTLRHDNLEFHLLLSSRGQRAGSMSFHHKVLNMASGRGLMNRSLPVEVLQAANSGSDIREVLFLVDVNTYYICIVERSENGYHMTVYKLLDNFKKIQSKTPISYMPLWLSHCDEELDFKAEGNVIVVQASASGEIMGIVYINNQGKIKFKPE